MRSSGCYYYTYVVTSTLDHHVMGANENLTSARPKPSLFTHSPLTSIPVRSFNRLRRGTPQSRPGVSLEWADEG